MKIMIIEWNEEKRQQLLTERGIDLAKVAEKISLGEIEAVFPNNNYPHQKKFLIIYNDYPCIVPVIWENERIFLKTVRPDRTKKIYLNNKK